MTKKSRKGAPGKGKATKKNVKTVNGRNDDSATSRSAQATTVETSGLVPMLIAGAVVFAAFLWAYWPTCAGMVHQWETKADYSHGYLVAPLAILILWVRRDLFPGFSGKMGWGGAVLIVLSIAMRALGARMFVDAIDAWSMLLWAAGAVWLFGGWRVFLWAAPAIGFLFFMIPLPFQAETFFSYPLQTVATKASTWTLQCLGQPAIAEGHTIRMGDHAPLEVERACSGLRVFMGTVAMAYAFIVLVRNTWWERLLLLASALPITIVANVTRIVVTGLLSQYVSGEVAGKFTHDMAGYVMLVHAFLLFLLALWFISNMTREMESVSVGDLLRSSST